MPESAEAHSSHLTTSRNCTVEIGNNSSVYCLVNPKVFMSQGFCHSPPQPTVRAGCVEVCSFTKDDNTATGCYGVMTYELFHMRNRCCSQLFALMFSVPHDYNLFENWLGVGVYPKDKPCDKELCEHMYNDPDEENGDFHRHKPDGSGVIFVSQGGRDKVDVRACMSSEGHAIIKLEIYDMM